MHPTWSFIARQRGAVSSARIRGGLEWDDGDVRVLLDPPGRFTRVRARFPLAAAPRFQVYGPHVMLESSTRFAYPRRDARYYFDRTHEVAAALVWAAPLRHHLLTYTPDARVLSCGAIVEVLVGRVANDPGSLAAVADLATRLAAADLFGLAALRALPGGTYEPSRGPWLRRSPPRAVVTGPAPVRVGPLRLGRRVVTRAELSERPTCGPLELEVTAGLEQAPAPLSAAGLSVAALRAVGHGTLTVRRDATRFTWTGVETDRDRLLAGVALLRSLVRGPSLGVFR
jgi:hypothetical protein